MDIEGKEDGRVVLQLLDAFRNECRVCKYLRHSPPPPPVKVSNEFMINDKLIVDVDSIGVQSIVGGSEFHGIGL